MSSIFGRRKKLESTKTEIDLRMHELMLNLADEWDHGEVDWDFSLLAVYMRAAYSKGYCDCIKDGGSLLKDYPE